MHADAAVLGVVPFAPATNELTLRRPRGNAEDRGLYLSIVSESLVGMWGVRYRVLRALGFD